MRQAEQYIEKASYVFSSTYSFLRKHYSDLNDAVDKGVEGMRDKINKRRK